MADIGAQVQAAAGQAVAKTKALGDELQGNLKQVGNKLKEAGARLPGDGAEGKFGFGRGKMASPFGRGVRSWVMR